MQVLRGDLGVVVLGKYSVEGVYPPGRGRATGQNAVDWRSPAATREAGLWDTVRSERERGESLVAGLTVLHYRSGARLGGGG